MKEHGLATMIKYGQRPNRDKEVELSSREQYTSGSGKVESYKKDKTRDHDEIVLRLKDGRRVVISNNTKLGVRVEPKEGDEVNYHGYGVKGTNVVHKVHPNRSSAGGWLEYVKKGESMRNFSYTGLAKLAGFIKKADPPHRGLNDTNPFIRHAHRTYGWVPQAPDSYFSSFNSEDDFNKQTAETIYTVGKENPATDGAWDANNALDDHLYDYFTSAGANKGSFYRSGGILLGSYPYDRKTVALHELGHGHDPNIPDRSRSDIDTETFAWDWAGIPTNNPIRIAALNTYKNNDYSRSAEFSRKLEDAAAQDNESWRSVGRDVNTNNVPIGARAADDERLTRMEFPDDYIERYPGIVPYLKSLHRKYNDYPPVRGAGPYERANRDWNWHHIYPEAWR